MTIKPLSTILEEAAAHQAALWHLRERTEDGNDRYKETAQARLNLAKYEHRGWLMENNVHGSYRTAWQRLDREGPMSGMSIYVWEAMHRYALVYPGGWIGGIFDSEEQAREEASRAGAVTITQPASPLTSKEALAKVIREAL